MKKDSSIINYLKQSSFYEVRGLMIPFIVFILLVMSFLYYSPNIYNYIIYSTEKYYSTKFLKDINQLREVAEIQDLGNLTDFIDKKNWHDDRVSLILMNVSSGIKYSEVDLLKFDPFDIKDYKYGKDIVIYYWWLFLLLIIVFPFAFFSTSEIPARLARRKQHSSEKLEII